MHPAFGLLVGYLLGSIPFAYIAGKVARGIDLRQHGSGNLGATNVYRTLGAKVASVVFVLDTLKGALPVLAVRQYAIGPHLDLWAIAAGVAAIVGHAKPIFLLWKGGGKGVATAGGVFLALAPIPTLASMATFIVVVLLSGYVSVASVTARQTSRPERRAGHTARTSDVSGVVRSIASAGRRGRDAMRSGWRWRVGNRPRGPSRLQRA